MAAANPPKLVWLCSAPSGLQGAPRDAVGGILRIERRRYVSLNELACNDPAILGLADRSGLDFENHQPGHVFALAMVQPKFTYDDLQLLSFPERAQCNFYKSLAARVTEAMFFFQIVHIQPLQTSVPVGEWMRIATSTFFTDLDDDTFIRLRDEWSRREHDANATWLLNIDLPSAAVRLPLPFAVFCNIGRWKSFCVCDLSGTRASRGGWNIGKSARPDGERVAVDRFGAGAFQPPRFKPNPKDVSELSFYDPDVAESFADQIRVVASQLQAFDPQVDLSKLSLHTTAFQGFIDELRGYLHTNGSLKSRSKAYDLLYLMRCFFLCDVLSSAANLKRALHAASRVLLPPRAASIIQASLDVKGAAVPSPSTISRLRGRIDVAWMLVWRARISEWLKQGLIIYPSTDGSPQGGRDFQILVLDFVPRQDLPQLHTLMVKMDARTLKCNTSLLNILVGV